MIKFEFPLINLEEFNILKITPVPMKIKKDLFGIMIPKHEMLALTKDSLTFSDFSETELSHCTKIPKTGYACPVLPNFQTNTSPSRDVAIVMNNNESMKLCQTNLIKINKELWIALHSKDMWAFSVVNPIIGIVTTSQLKKHKVELKGSGILTLEPGAELKTDFVTLKSPIDTISEIDITFVVSQMDTSLNLKAEEIKINVPISPNLINMMSWDKLRSLTKDIDVLELAVKEPLETIEHKKELNLWKYTTSGGFIGIIILGGCLLWKLNCITQIYKWCTICKKNKKLRVKSNELRLTEVINKDRSEKIEELTQELDKIETSNLENVGFSTGIVI